MEPAGYLPPEGGGGSTDAVDVNGKHVTFGHGGRHINNTGLKTNQVNQHIANEVSNLNLKQGQFYKGQILIDGIMIEYTSYGVSDTVTNVGTYYPLLY